MDPTTITLLQEETLLKLLQRKGAVYSSNLQKNRIYVKKANAKKVENEPKKQRIEGDDETTLLFSIGNLCFFEETLNRLHPERYINDTIVDYCVRYVVNYH